MNIKLYLVEDHEMLRDGLRVIAAKHPDIEIKGEAATVAAASRGLVEQDMLDVLLIDFALPDGDGMSLVPLFKKRFPCGKVIVMSGAITRPLVRSCLVAGADGFVSKEEGSAEILRAIRTVPKGDTFLSTKAASVVAAVFKHVDPSAVSRLSDQEIMVLRGIAMGQTYKEIAQILGISVKSVETYRARLVRKTGLRSRAELARFAATNHLVT